MTCYEYRQNIENSGVRIKDEQERLSLEVCSFWGADWLYYWG